MKIRIHNIIPISEANGPGKRFAIWVQGCQKNCKGCFNPKTHNLDGGKDLEIESLLNQIYAQPSIEGVSISGGEPLLQAEEIYTLTKDLKQKKLSVLIFTGYTMDEIKSDPKKMKILENVDILIAGPYDEKLKSDNILISSTNQELFLLSDRYTIDDFNYINKEIIIDSEGNIIITGISPEAMDD